MVARRVDILVNPRSDHLLRLMPTFLSQLKPPAFEAVQGEDAGDADILLRVDGKTISGEGRVISAVNKLVENPDEKVEELERV